MHLSYSTSDGVAVTDYKIASKSETDDNLYPLWWNNSDGWVSFEDSDTFTAEEQKSLRLPVVSGNPVWVTDTDYRYFTSPRGVN